MMPTKSTEHHRARRAPRAPHAPRAQRARVAPPLWLVLPGGLLGLFFGLFGGAVWSVVFRATGLDTSAQQYGSTPFIFGLWFLTVLLLGVAANRAERVWRRRAGLA